MRVGLDTTLALLNGLRTKISKFLLRSKIELIRNIPIWKPKTGFPAYVVPLYSHAVTCIPAGIWACRHHHYSIEALADLYGYGAPKMYPSLTNLLQKTLLIIRTRQLLFWTKGASV